MSEEHTNVSNVSTVLPVDPVTGAISPTPFTVTDDNALTGWNIGTYVQDEWKITNQLTLNTGLRFDQLYQYVDANQLSPRVALIYKPFAGTTVHAGYARYFTPPYQAQAAQANLALFTNTTNQPEVPLDDPVKPERSNYYDVGIDQTLLPGLDVGVDGYYKDARDMLDDGQFGQAVVLTQFNWARGYSEGGEFKLKYKNGNFSAYGNFAYNITRAIGPESNQYILDAATYNYLLTNWHYTDDMQLMTGSAGVSYRWHDTLFTTNLISGSGLRAGDLSARRRAKFPTHHALRRDQCRRGARFQMVAGRQAAHRAVRYRQSVRPDLRAARRHRHRRLCPAIRGAARLLRRHFAKAVTAARRNPKRRAVHRCVPFAQRAGTSALRFIRWTNLPPPPQIAVALTAAMHTPLSIWVDSVEKS